MVAAAIRPRALQPGGSEGLFLGQFHEPVRGAPTRGAGNRFHGPRLSQRSDREKCRSQETHHETDCARRDDLDLLYRHQHGAAPERRQGGHEPKSRRLHEGGPPVVNPQFRGGLGGPELGQSLEKTLRRFGSEPNGARGCLAPDHTSRQRFTRPCRPLIKVALWNLRATIFNTVAARLAVRNLLDCLVGIQEVGGSKPLAPTTSSSPVRRPSTK
jgi:hypothetical protein